MIHQEAAARDPAANNCCVWWAGFLTSERGFLAGPNVPGKGEKGPFSPILVRPQPQGPEPARGEEREGFQWAGERGSQANRVLEVLSDGLQPGFLLARSLWTLPKPGSRVPRASIPGGTRIAARCPASPGTGAARMGRVKAGCWSWFNPSGSSAEMGERIRQVKVRKLVDREKNTLTGKAEAAQSGRAKQGLHSALPMAGGCSATAGTAGLCHT